VHASVYFSRMGRKTHGPYLVAAIEYNDIEKVSEILAKQFRDRQAVRHLLVSPIPRLTSDQTEIPLLLAASLQDPAILRYFVLKHHVDVNHIFESGSHTRRRRTSALLTALHHGHYDTVDAILSLNGDINVADHKGRRPLHRAIKRSVSVCWHGNWMIVESVHGLLVISTVNGNGRLSSYSGISHCMLLKCCFFEYCNYFTKID